MPRVGSPRSTSHPWLHQLGRQIQEYGKVRWFPIGLGHDARMYSCQRLNQILADTQILYAHYKKHHWLVRGHTSTSYTCCWTNTRASSSNSSTSSPSGCIGGVAVGDPRHVAEITQVSRPPNGVEEVPAMLPRLLETHEVILTEAHDAAGRVAELGDDGTNDLLVSDIIRTAEMQAWFLAEHLVDTPLVRSAEAASAAAS